MPSKIQCGFVAHPGRPFDQRIADAFASRVNVEGQPFGFRIHEWRRDGPEARIACDWARAHGMTPYVVVVAPDPAPFRLPDSVSVTYGNGHDWTLASMDGDHIEDDSGPVGAMKIMRNRTARDRTLVFHAYGQSGFKPGNMLEILRREATEKGVKELIWGECHWGFPGLDKTLADRPDVTSAGAGAYCRESVMTALVFGIKCAMFLPRYFFDKDGEPNAAGRVFFGYEQGVPLTPPLLKSWKMEWSMMWA